MADWQPSASPDTLRQRAQLLARIRDFFSQHQVLEVETPLLCAAGVTDPALEPILSAPCVSSAAPRYLQTSPEYAMKRLLAAGSGPIYQIAKVFRDGEVGGRHNPEFSMLEWYRPGFDHHQLIDEVAALLQHCLGEVAFAKISYRQLFLDHLQIDPFKADAQTLAQCAAGQLDVTGLEGDKDMWLDLLISHCIEPKLAELGAVCVYDYPASQAALAKIASTEQGPVGQRFEVYLHGVELANGYCELTDAAEQRQRFVDDNAKRAERGLPERPLDELLLAAMEHGLPDCAGVALGVDRLAMVALGQGRIEDVLAFSWERA